MICTYYDVLIELVVSEILDPETACNFLTLCPQIVTMYQLNMNKFDKAYVFQLCPKNQHTQRKLLNFENWVNGEVSKIEHHFRK